MEIRKLLTIKQVVEILGISDSTLRTFTKAGRIRAIHVGRSVRYEQTEVMRFISMNRNEGVKNG